MEILFHLILLFGFSFLIRFIFSSRTGSDNFNHLWMVDEQSQYRDLRLHNVKNSIFEGIRGYPRLIHFLIGLFPKPYWFLAGKLLALTYDCLSVAVVYLTSRVIFTDLWNIPGEPGFQAFVTALLFSSTPLFFPITARLISIGGRTFGGFLHILFVVCYGAAHIYSNPWFYLPCVILVFLITLSSKFALQNLIGVCIFLSLAGLTWIPITLLAAGILISLLPVFDGRKLLVSNFSYLVHWFVPYLKKHQEEEIEKAGRNRIKDFLLFPYFLFNNPKRAFELFTYQNSLIIASYSTPAAFLFFYYLITQKNTIPFEADFVFTFSMELIGAALVLFLLTSWRKLLFLGEAERYLEFALFPLNLLIIYLVYQHSTVPLQTLFFLFCVNLSVICLLFILCNSGTYMEVLKNSPDFQVTDLAKFLNTLERPRIICLPTKFTYHLALFVNDSATFYYREIYDSSSGLIKRFSDEAREHYFIPDFDHFHQKYHVDTFVFSKSEVARAKRLSIVYELDRLEEIFQNESFFVGRIPGK